MKSPINMNVTTAVSPRRPSGLRFLLALHRQRFEARLRRFTGNPFAASAGDGGSSEAAREPMPAALTAKR